MSDLLIFLFALLFSLSLLVIAWWAASIRGWRRGYAAGKGDALAEQRAKEMFVLAGLEIIPGLKHDDRTFIAIANIVCQTKSGLRFAVYSNQNVLAAPQWEPDPEMANVIADKLEAERFLRKQYA